MLTAGSIRTAVLSITVIALGCAAARASSPAAPSASTQDAEVCSTAQRLVDGGSFMRSGDGVAIWYKLSGRPGAPTIAYLHGGPGYNSLAFEKSSGKLLERRFQLLYVDQRGCGRSGFHGSPGQYGMAKTVDDLEDLRARVGVGQLVLVGHSFGGLVAAEYAHRFPARVSAVVMIDTMPDIGRALEYQVAYVDSIADGSFPAKAAEVHAVAASTGTPFEKLSRLYALLGRVPLQRRLHYAEPQVQERMETMDADSGIMPCTSGDVVAAFQREGSLSAPVPSVATRIAAPTLLVAGRASHVIGEDNIRFASEAWGARIEWIDAGHFVYFEKPNELVATVERFVGEAAVRP